MRRSVVIGGGLVGSLVAIQLARRGHKVDVFERHPDSRIETESKRPALNLTLCERGLQALGEVGLRERVESLAVPALGRSIHGEDGFTAFQPYGSKGEAIYSIARSELNDTLINFAEGLPNIEFHFGQKCTHIDLAGASARFEDARTGAITEVQADRIFGADGAYSAVRLHLQKLERFNYSQQYLTEGYKSLKIPARADGTSALQSGVLHIWPRGRRMLIGFPNRDASVSLSLLLPFEGEHSFASLTTEDELRSFFRAWFPDAAELIPELAEQFFARPANSLITIRCGPWSCEDKVLILGDAAHAILPSYGQGANAGFDDCSVLVRCMDEHGDDWRSVFRDFEARRRPSMDYMANLCIEHFVELCELVGDPTFLKRKAIERQLHDLYPDLYQSLYNMVTFTTMPYIEAMRIEDRQRRFMDRLLAGGDFDVEGPQIKELLLALSREED